ncbi:putative structural maintenance of chromosomes protein [Rosa chinensis]|uniref:Structural maintenance of chromosomes protein n=1 Tax=Rosa chinensis TaxID=74649 RepID=A0A2P6PDN7_ROSCH|nr:putative structural maintenance of chromosomes protein [Rosa chinensis]
MEPPPDEFMADGSDSRKPRLFIREMVLRNFKSYAGEQRVGPFHKSFSAVVGPNGSGKSNVIDAMLFVFGKRAKQMRLNRVSELIHNSPNCQNIDSAGVSVHFQEIMDLDDGTFEAVPGSDFVITRVAYRDNSSKYYINDRSSNFTEVTKNLKGKGVDLDNNRFLILQGEVEQISLMKPKAQGSQDEGFLEYLEDIIGTSKYAQKIDESYQELESLNEKRSGVVQMVKLAEKERDGLEDGKNEAETYMLKELSLLKWQEKATKLAHEDTSAKMLDLQENITSLEENLNNDREKIQERNNALKELESTYDKDMKQQEELYIALNRYKDEFKHLEKERAKYLVNLQYVEQKIKKLDEKLEKDSLKIGDRERDCENSISQIPELEKSIRQLQKLLLDEEKVLEEIIEDSKGDTETYCCELTTVRSRLEPWEKQPIEHRKKFDVAYTERKLLDEKHQAGRAAFEDARKQMDDIWGLIQTKTADITKIRNELEKSKFERTEYRKAEQEYIKEQEALIPCEQAARQKVAELKHLLDSEKSRGRLLKAILHAKLSNRIPGIHGRLGDLGAIDEQYDVAISTACPGLDNIVVETTDGAIACVELLRRENLGVANFMIMEKITDRLPVRKENVRTPEGVPHLFDLVRVEDQRMKVAFFKALKNTVVAKDLDQAARIAYGGNPRFRAVTLDGALFEISGTMTGGGSKPCGGKIGRSICTTVVSEEAVTDASRELASMTDKLNHIRQHIADAAKRYQASEDAIAHWELELAKSQKEIDSLSSQHSYLEMQIGSLEAASQPKKDEVDQLRKLDSIISAEGNKIDELIQGSKQLKEKVLELQHNIENAGGESLKVQKSKVNKIKSDIDEKNTELNRHKVQIETGQQTIKELRKVIQDSKKKYERHKKENETLCANFKEKEEKASLVQENYEETQKLIDEHKAVLDKAKSEYCNMKKTVYELRAWKDKAEFELEAMKKKYKDLKFEWKAYKDKLDKLQTALIKHMDQIQKDLVESEKVQATLADEHLNSCCDLQRAIETAALLEAQMKEMNPNLDSISEYQRKISLYNERVEDLSIITKQRDDIKRQYDELRRKRHVTFLLDDFMGGFNAISLKLKEMYQMITLGGDAELELVDSLDPFSEGVVFSVRPPKKSWKNISNLSGGETTLSSLALVFALHHYKPTPLYVMDEIDAALGTFELNSCCYHLNLFLRNNMFELADRLVGIYKTHNRTKSITIDPRSFVICNEAAQA